MPAQPDGGGAGGSGVVSVRKGLSMLRIPAVSYSRVAAVDVWFALISQECHDLKLMCQ